MTEKETIKALEEQAANTKRLMDQLNRAAYGLTFDELIKHLGNGKEDEKNGSNDARGDQSNGSGNAYPGHCR